MLQTFLTAAAEHAEPSKTAFYVTGGLLVAWAAAVTVLGMRSETFPSDGWTFRGVIAVSAVLVAATMLAAAVTG